jgi:hypothetical protein
MKKFTLLATATAFLTSILLTGCGVPADEDYIYAPSNSSIVSVIQLDTATPSDIIRINNEGREAVCKMSVGTYQYWTSDSYEFYSNDIGYTVPHNENEEWLDINSNSVYSIMIDRINYAYQIGCDSVVLTNTDSWEYNTGFYISEYDEEYYLSELISEINYFGMDAGVYEIDIYNSYSIERLFDFTIE